MCTCTRVLFSFRRVESEKECACRESESFADRGSRAAATWLPAQAQAQEEAV